MQKHYEAYWDRDNPPPLDDPLAGKRAEIFWGLVSQLPSRPTSFLDAGCGSGWLAASATERGLDAVGMDIAGNAISIAQRQYPGTRYLEHSLEEIPWPLEPASIDVVTSFEVIEHLLEPELLVKGMQEVLRPGGYAAITTPYHGRLKNVAISLINFDHHFNVVGDHIRFFSDKSLASLLQSHGFSVEKFVHFGRVPGLWAGTFVWARKK